MSIAEPFAERLVCLHERDFGIQQASNHGLRRIVHAEIVRRFGTDGWVMLCHADAFCFHDPRAIAERAEREGYHRLPSSCPTFSRIRMNFPTGSGVSNYRTPTAVRWDLIVVDRRFPVRIGLSSEVARIADPSYERRAAMEGVNVLGR